MVSKPQAACTAQAACGEAPQGQQTLPFSPAIPGDAKSPKAGRRSHPRQGAPEVTQGRSAKSPRAGRPKKSPKAGAPEVTQAASATRLAELPHPGSGMQLTARGDLTPAVCFPCGCRLPKEPKITVTDACQLPSSYSETGCQSNW